MKRLYNSLRTTVTQATNEDIVHEDQTKEKSNLKMIEAKKRWLMDYQAEREKKRDHVRRNVVALGLDDSKIVQKIKEMKGTLIPSLDDIDMTELQNIVEELVQEENMDGDKLEEQKAGDNGGSGENYDVTSNQALFDRLQVKEDKELDDSVSSVRSSNSFRSMSTRKSKLTILNQKPFSQIYVSEVF